MERAGIAVDDYAAFEIDKYAIAVSAKNYPEIRRFGNVFDGDFKRFNGYDLLIGARRVHTGLSRKKIVNPR